MGKFLAQYMPVNVSAHGAKLDELNAMVHWLMLVLFVGWGIYFVITLVKFRAGRHPKAQYEGTKNKFSTASEIGVVVVEAVLLLVFAIPTWSRWVTPPPKESNPLEVRVMGEQFAWNIHYPGADNVFGRADIKLVDSSNPVGLDLKDPNAKDDIITVNQLHMEANRPVIVRLTSKDVIHSFKLPVMRVTQDAIPGQEIPVYFTPVKASGSEKWEIACAQLCGLGHYRMRGYITVHEKAGFEAWLRENAPVPLAPPGAPAPIVVPPAAVVSAPVADAAAI